MELTVAGGSAINVSEATFGRDFSEALVHQVVTAYLAGGRAGTKAQKTVPMFVVVVVSRGNRKAPAVPCRYHSQPDMARWWQDICCPSP